MIHDYISEKHDLSDCINVNIKNFRSVSIIYSSNDNQ